MKFTLDSILGIYFVFGVCFTLVEIYRNRDIYADEHQKNLSHFSNPILATLISTIVFLFSWIVEIFIWPLVLFELIRYYYFND